MVSPDIKELKKQLGELKKGRKEREEIKRLKFQIISEKIAKTKIVRAIKNTIEFTGQINKAHKKIMPNVREVIKKLPA